MVDTGSGPILFYNRDEPYYEFTNFYRARVKLDGKWWPTTEHYFQAQKFVGTPYVEQIRKLEAPRMAFNLSRNPQVARWRREDWEQEKVNVMYKALLAKFSQHEKLRNLLLGTGHRELIEHSPYDRYWGDGGDGTGENMLGCLLMKVRGEMLGEPVEMPQPSYLTPRQADSSTVGAEFSSLPPMPVNLPILETEPLASLPPYTMVSSFPPEHASLPALEAEPTASLPTHDVVSSLKAPFVVSSVLSTEQDTDVSASEPPAAMKVMATQNPEDSADLTTGTGEPTPCDADQAVVGLQEDEETSPAHVPEDVAEIANTTSEAAEAVPPGGDKTMPSGATTRDETTPPGGIVGDMEAVTNTQEDKHTVKQADTESDGVTPTMAPTPGSVPVLGEEPQSYVQDGEQEEEMDVEEEEEGDERESKDGDAKEQLLVSTNHHLAWN